MSSDDERFSKELPTDILAEILSRLPSKSFHRFKAVSKSWLALSSDPNYSKKFRKFQLAGLFCKLDDIYHTSSTTHFASLSEGSELLDATMTDFPHPKDCDLELLDCCNGLLLFRCRRTMDPPCFYISNPFTKKWIVHPMPTTRYCGKFVLAYDPSVSAHFQVILFEVRKSDNVIRSLNCMSSDNGEWNRSIIIAMPNPLQKKIATQKRKVPRPVLVNHINAGNVLLDGTMYLLVSKHILAVKIEGWSCSMIRLPKTSATVENRITKCKGKLQFISNTVLTIQIWDLDLQISKIEWILKHKLDVHNLYMQPMRSYPRVIQVHPDHEVIFIFCWKDEDTRSIVYSCDVSNGEMEEYSTVTRLLNQNIKSIWIVLFPEASFPICKPFPLHRSVIPDSLSLKRQSTPFSFPVRRSLSCSPAPPDSRAPSISHYLKYDLLTAFLLPFVLVSLCFSLEHPLSLRVLLKLCPHIGRPILTGSYQAYPTSFSLATNASASSEGPTRRFT